MLTGRARSPITAFAQSIGSVAGLRSKTRTRYPRRGSARTRYCPIKPVAPVSAIRGSFMCSRSGLVRSGNPCFQHFDFFRIERHHVGAIARSECSELCAELDEVGRMARSETQCILQ